MIPRQVLQTDAGRAAVTQAWLDGHTQVRIARRCFGYRTNFAVCVVIERFVRKYVPESFLGLNKENAPLAIARFIATRDAANGAASGTDRSQ